MVLKKIIIGLAFLLCHGGATSFAQQIAVSNNAFFDAAGALSAGLEVASSKVSSFEVYGVLSPWKRGNYSVHKYWLAEAQYRYWPCQVMNGLFIGPYIHGGEFNLGNRSLPFRLLKGLEPSRYEGWLAGVGIGVGYEFPLAKHWNIGAELGAGYTYIDYKKNNCELCGSLKDDDVYHYFGLSKLALSLIYLF